MRGIIVSTRALTTLKFLNQVGPSTFLALLIASRMGPRKLSKTLKQLRTAGYVYLVRTSGREFVVPKEVDYFDLKKQEILSLFAARLVESGGQYEFGQALFPGGQIFAIKAGANKIFVGDFQVNLHDLKEKPLKECLKKKP
ncbi:MAG: hypothetical protein GX295_11865 [Syntrophomonadaceae bacterium]|nr:hypothetical protein [Syntrophomonadaceae bacterium]